MTKINGPINAVRMEGKFGGVTKTLNIFMDLHMPVMSQTQCDSIFSKELRSLLVESFQNNPDKTYDLFFEIQPSWLALPATSNRSRYIDDIVNVFLKEFSFDKKKNKVSHSKSFSNVRLHYVDIRDYIEQFLGEDISTITRSVDDMWHHYSLPEQQLANIKKITGYVYARLQFIYNSLYGNTIVDKNKKKQIRSKLGKSAKQTAEVKTEVEAQQKMTAINDRMYAPQESDKIFLNFVEKLLSRYHNGKVKDVINKFLNTVIKGEMEAVFKNMDRFIITLNAAQEFAKVSHNTLVRNDEGVGYGASSTKRATLLAELHNGVSTIDVSVLFCLVKMMDVYFLRRFLDKEYVQNAIIYTGIAHSCTYIYMLNKYFDFKITHISYAKITDIDELNVAVKKSRDIDDVKMLFYPPKVIQCSDLSTFPPL